MRLFSIMLFSFMQIASIKSETLNLIPYPSFSLGMLPNDIAVKAQVAQI